MTYAQAIRNLGDARAFVLLSFRAYGGSADRWQRKDREAMADAITRAEDNLEIEHSQKKPLREALKQTRRDLELELWP